ncbi:MAG: DUF3015 domain-containing protein [Nitrospirota bacterium]
MLKKLLIVTLAIGIFLVMCGLSFAKDGYGSAGCGLGSLLIGPEPGFVQVFAATTNGTSGNQTFGMTSGTSNCDKQAIFASNKRLFEFVHANMDNLAKDIAMGKGESMDTLAELMAIPVENRPIVYAKLQSNFSNIFPSEKVEAGEIIDNIYMTTQ